MNNQPLYMPVLKAKDGELRSLGDLTPSVREQIAPLIEIPVEGIRDYDTMERYPLEHHLNKVHARLVRNWTADSPLRIDFGFDPAREIKGKTAAQCVFDWLRSDDIRAVPVTRLDAGYVYQDVVRAAIAVDELGVCIRIGDADFPVRSLSRRLEDVTEFLGVRPEETDIVIDVGAIDEDSTQTVLLAVQTVMATIPNVQQLRSLTLAGAGFPQHLGGCTPDAITELGRPEWRLWLELWKLRSNLRRMPRFGDYGVQHPLLGDFDPKRMKMSAAIRYTTESGYIVAKGRAIGQQRGWEQTHELATWIVGRQEFKGADFSWGDRYIADSANGAAGPGGATVWRAIATNHHVTLAADQVARLGGS